MIAHLIPPVYIIHQKQEKVAPCNENQERHIFQLSIGTVSRNAFFEMLISPLIDE